MFKLILSDNTEIPVSNGSTLFDIMVEPVQYSSMWNHLTERNLKHVRLVSGNGDLLDQKENLVVDSEHSFHEKESVKCHFYLREKTEVELTPEGVRVQLERMKELCKERNNLYEEQNDLKGQKQKLEKSLER